MGKTKVIHRDIRPWQDDGDGGVAFLPLPFVERHIDEIVGHALEEEFGGEHRGAIDSHAGVNLVFGGCKLAHLACKILALNIIYIRGSERVASPREGVACSNLLAHNDIFGTHERVALGEHGQHIAIELKSQQHDEHTTKVGKEKAYELRHTDVLTQ